jgi:pyruvate-formate lyase-activating enzyme
MHLSDVLSARARPCAGVYLAITRRCPLSCAHCCSDSYAQSEEYSADIFLNFVSSMDRQNRPDFLFLTGGEPLLRPGLVRMIADRVGTAGTKVVLGSGFFFANALKPSKPIQRALDAVDHVTVSIDVFHEKEVPRANVFRVVKELLRRKKSVSFQIVGFNESDPYLVDVTREIELTFGTEVPALVGKIGPRGRGKRLLGQDEEQDEQMGRCAAAAWPVVTYDGTVVACCNYDVVGSMRSPHLVLGHAGTDSWSSIRDRALSSPALRAIRLYGPMEIARVQAGSSSGCRGYCSTCRSLSKSDNLESVARRMLSGPVAFGLEELVKGASLDVQSLNLPGYEAWSVRGLNTDKANHAQSESGRY